MKIIDSKERVFCQCSSRALQEKARPASASVGARSLFCKGQSPDMLRMYFARMARFPIA